MREDFACPVRTGIAAGHRGIMDFIPGYTSPSLFDTGKRYTKLCAKLMICAKSVFKLACDYGKGNVEYYAGRHSHLDGADKVSRETILIWLALRKYSQLTNTCRLVKR